ncbi:TetR/AcrR family transcriptional regulator [uncultured Jatrophihabitans sp.]|uniref:TetR/AcrR family transcriptional regulator n=1 Tax=uncultured Jatrophihabitans sp. TaxID=1610747 RepID=UPI0035CA2171
MGDVGNKGGRPRSEQARAAVLHAVDDLLVEVGYAAMTMKGIAERAGVGRQTVYRWWSTKAEILFEASMYDAGHELSVPAWGDALRQVTEYLLALTRFLTTSDAGAAYRALVAAAQQDAAVAELIASKDILGDSARVVLGRVAAERPLPVSLAQATASLVGPTFYWILSGRDPRELRPAELAKTFLADLDARTPA